ncbi:MAG: glycosyltransferase family 4 protein [Phycisphaerales bacterium]
MPPPETTPDADAVVLCLPEGETLASWHDDGRLDQQRPLIERFARCELGAAIVADAGPAVELPDRVSFVPRGETPGQDVADALHITPGARVVTRTMQLTDGGASAMIAETLRARGVEVGRIARGGHVRSRFIGLRDGAETPQAIRAGEIERDLCQHSDIVVGTTGKMVDDLAWRWALPDERCRVIPNFVDDATPADADAPREAGVVLVVGPLEPFKNTDLILRAIGAMPRAARGSFTLEIVGDGSQRAELETLAAELGVNTRFLGKLPHAAVLERMRACAAYVQASSYEGHPTALIEAMACGAPVIVADTPGLGIVVDNGVSGVIVPGTPESITYALSGVLEDDGWRAMLGRSAAAAAVRRYGIGRVFELECEACSTALEFARRAPRQAA